MPAAGGQIPCSTRRGTTDRTLWGLTARQGYSPAHWDHFTRLSRLFPFFLAFVPDFRNNWLANDPADIREHQAHRGHDSYHPGIVPIVFIENNLPADFTVFSAPR